MIPLGTLRASAILALAIAAPWLSLLPLPGLGALVAATITLIAAFHGYGLLIATALRRNVAPALAVQWGIALTIALGGLLISVGAYRLPAQTILVYTGAALHSLLLAAQFSRRAEPVAECLRHGTLRYSIVPSVLVIAVGALHILGAVGDFGARPFDDDGNHLAQLQRLIDTGTLGDAIGFPRTSQLGGQLTLGALANVVGGPAFLRMVDSGLGFTLVLWLAISRIRPRDPSTALCSVLLVIVAAALPFVTPDPAPRWIAAGLVLALFATVQDHAEGAIREVLPISLIAGALTALRLELAPVAVVGVMAAWALRDRAEFRASRRFLVLVLVPVATLLPFVFVRIAARSEAGDALALLVPRRSGFLPLGVVTGTGVVAAMLTRRMTDRLLAWLVFAIVVGVTAIVTQLVGLRPYSIAFLAPIVIGAGLAVVTRHLRAQPTSSIARPGTAMLVFALLACVVTFQGRDASGRVRWSRRYTELISGVEIARTVRVDSSTTIYARLMQHVPAGEAVGVWVLQPESLDYAAHRIFDLRSPRVAALRGRATTASSTLTAVIGRLPVRFLLIEIDHHGPAERRQTLFGRLWCDAAPADPLCLDELERLAQGDVVATEANVRLVALRSGR
ncbi:MAG: hypothetical protein JWP01_2313 [Myxococcales bacterium]|nr:hypothetical protein [Myxococcales bacterium]